MKTKALAALDYGTKFCGVAFCNEAGHIFPYQVSTHDQLEDTVQNLINEKNIEGFIIGLPRSTDGSENQLCVAARQMGRRLKRQFDLPISFVDERFSSKAVVTKGEKKRIDDQAAAQILEYYLAGL